MSQPITNSILRTFPTQTDWPKVVRGEGMHLEFADGRKLLDFTAGGTEHAVLGWQHPKINEAIRQQLTKIAHVDVKFYSEENAECLSQLMVSASQHRLTRVYFAGNSGGEACEAAMKLSYQVHYDNGCRRKRWYLGREQSYHGISSDNLAFCDREHLKIYKPFYPKFRATISEHNPHRHQQIGESEEQYALRSAAHLEQKILELGADNVAGFVAETMQGGLVGAVPPAERYWREIRRICDQYNVHLIVDEVWCGNGASGRYNCIDWDDVVPDFLFVGKLLAAGYAPVSAVMMREEIALRLESSPQKRIQHGSTYQSYTLGLAAALAAQRIVSDAKFLDQIKSRGEYLRDNAYRLLRNHSYFGNIRGRGLRLAIEVTCDRADDFTRTVSRLMRTDGIILDGKWHRILLCPAFIVTESQIDFVLERLKASFDLAAG